MIETIEGAQQALRKHEAWCQRLVCTECDAHADVSDLLAVVRRVLANAPLTSDPPPSEMVATLLARAPVPTNDGGGVIPLESIHE